MDGLIVGGEGGLSEGRARLLTCKLDGGGGAIHSKRRFKVAFEYADQGK